MRNNMTTGMKILCVLLIISTILIILTYFGAIGVEKFGVTEYEEKSEQIEQNSSPKKEITEDQNTNDLDQESEKTNWINNLQIHFIDVGQADAIYIQQNNHYMLIDAGNNGDSELVVNYLKSQGVQELEYLIGTHPHEDHIGGLDGVINTFEVDRVLMPKVTSTTKTFEDVLKAIQSKGLKITAPSVGATYELGEATFTILGPVREDYEDVNDHSIVLQLEYEETSFLFMGDAEVPAETDILNLGMKSIESDVIKIGHHGSSSSTSNALLDNASANIAVISVGQDNDYGHPNKEVMERLQSKGIRVYRTDQSGTIIATSDGKKIDFNVQSGDYTYRSIEETKEADYQNEVSEETNTTDTSVDKENTKVKIGAEQVAISDLDKGAEVITITNNGTGNVQLKEWKIVSVAGNQTFIFPTFILEEGESVKVGGYDSRSIVDFVWEQGKGVWNNTSKDPAELYDANGTLVSQFND